jgi:mono/diheme cytochrome c family protein/AcrR family transcriptional regulator
LLALVFAAGCGLTLASARAEADRPDHLREFSAAIRPVLASRCFECHGVDEKEGGVDLARLKSDGDVLRSRALWKRAAARVAAGEMPPPDDAEPLSKDERDRLVGWMRAAAEYVDCGDPARRDPGPATLRRLSRVEYDNTIRDLLGLSFDSAREVGMPGEEAGGDFENHSASLGVSPALIDKYFAAADKVVEAVFARDGQGANARKRLFVARPGPDLPAPDAARRVVTRLARLAYRSPPGEADLARLLRFYDRAVARGEPFDDAVRSVLKPLLVSPRFLFRVEQDRPSGDGSLGTPVDDHELAVRLSYFLWSTMPDDELFRLADAGRLSDPSLFPVQIQRMLADPKARALTDNFAAPWLQLKTLNYARPTTEFFPTFNDTLKRAMRDEVTTFFDKLRAEDGRILDLLDADYTYVNEPLAAHYGIPGVDGPAMRKVSLEPGQHRGGLLGMAGVLTLTSHTFRTSPTQRGKYVLGVLLGTPPPPPPANAGQLKEDKPAGGKKDVTTFREQLARHATQASCAACHRKIDPLGFALDNFNAIGSWREGTAESPLDVSGVLPTGEAIRGVGDLKRVLMTRKDEFARNVVEKMMVYALGRELDYFDECAVRDALAALRAGDYRFSALVRGVVESVPFRNRRAATTPTH